MKYSLKLWKFQKNKFIVMHLIFDTFDEDQDQEEDDQNRENIEDSLAQPKVLTHWP